MRVEEKLTRNFYRVDPQSHISLQREVCQQCRTRICLKVCPAGLYKINELGELTVEYSGCLECGSCLISCPSGAIGWEYPRSGYGVQYRYG